MFFMSSHAELHVEKADFLKILVTFNLVFYCSYCLGGTVTTSFPSDYSFIFHTNNKYI